MFVIFLKFSENKSQAGAFKQAHKDWIKAGFDEGVFLLVGNLQPEKGGAIFAHNSSRAEIENRVKADPFVKENIVSAEISEITPSKTDSRIEFLAQPNH